jgi:hypothetical protein
MKLSLITASSFLAAIMLFEIFLRFSPFSYGITPMIYDKDIGMWHKRNFSNYLIQDCYQNKYFFDNFGRVKNNYQYDTEKKDIVIIGDSQIEALQVENKSVIHNSLFKELNGKFNVLNYGLAGTGPSQQLEILKHKVDLNNISSLVQLILLENDFGDGDQNNLERVNRPKVYIEFKDNNDFKIIKPKPYNYQEKLRDFLGNFELYIYLKKTYYYYTRLFSYDQIISSVSTADEQTFIPAGNMKAALLKEKQINGVEMNVFINENYMWKQLEGAIYQTKQLALKNNFKYTVLVISSFEINGLSDYRIKFEKFLNAHDIDVVNIVPFLELLEVNNELAFSCDAHWNKNTHLGLAKFLSENIDF